MLRLFRRLRVGHFRAVVASMSVLLCSSDVRMHMSASCSNPNLQKHGTQCICKTARYQQLFNMVANKDTYDAVPREV